MQDASAVWNIFCAFVEHRHNNNNSNDSEGGTAGHRLLAATYSALTARHNPHGAAENTWVRRLGRADESFSILAA